MTPSENSTPMVQPLEGQIDRRTYWRVGVRRRWLIVGTFLAPLLVSSGYTFWLPKIYTANATLVIELAAPNALGSGTVALVAESGTTSYWYSKEYYETQFNVIH